MENDDIFDGLGVEITLKTKEDFLKVKETLTRIGISSRTDKKLWQSCHILHKRGKYAIMHFKEMFVLDGLSSDISDEDLGRRNVIVKLLVEWGLIVPVDEEEYKEPMIPLNKLKIISHKEKGDWQLIPKYHIGRK
jgi:Bacteriophage translational regulator